MTDQLTHSPADIVRGLLITMACGTDPSDDLDWPVYAVNQPDTPANLIWVQDTGGNIQGWHQINGDSIESHGVTILVRSDDWTTGFHKMQEIRHRCNRITLQEVQATGGDQTESYVIHSVTPAATFSFGLGLQSKQRLFSQECLVRLTQLT